MQLFHILSVLMCVKICGAKLLLVETKDTNNTETENNETGLKISDKGLKNKRTGLKNNERGLAKKLFNLTSDTKDQDEITSGEDYMIGTNDGFAPSYMVISEGGVKKNYGDVLGLYVQTGGTTNFPGQKCNPRLPIYKHESKNIYLYVQCGSWVINHSLNPNAANIFAFKTKEPIPVKGWRYWHHGKNQLDATMMVLGGFAPSYMVKSEGGVKKNYGDVLGLYVQTGGTTNFPGQKCNPRLPIYKHESKNIYLYVQCGNWAITHTLNPNGANIFAARSKEPIPVKGWRYWHHGKHQLDATMMVLGGLYRANTNEIKIEKNKKVDELPYIGKEFSVSFELFLDSDPAADVPWATVLHLTIGGNIAAMGDRIPAVWVTSAKELHVASAISGSSNSHENYPVEIGKWIKVEINQKLVNGKHMFEVLLDGERKRYVENTTPDKYDNIKVFAGDDWYPAALGKIKNLKIATSSS